MEVNRGMVLLLPNREITARISYHGNNADGDARGETLAKRFWRMGEKMARGNETHSEKSQPNDNDNDAPHLNANGISVCVCVCCTDMY